MVRGVMTVSLDKTVGGELDLIIRAAVRRYRGSSDTAKKLAESEYYSPATTPHTRRWSASLHVYSALATGRESYLLPAGSRACRRRGVTSRATNARVERHV